MATRQVIVTVGTSPNLVMTANPLRKAWRVTFFSTALFVGNTGNLFVGRGRIPTATLGDPNQGSVLIQGQQILESRSYEEDSIFQGDMWLLASAAGQIVEVEEDLELPK